METTQPTEVVTPQPEVTPTEKPIVPEVVNAADIPAAAPTPEDIKIDPKTNPEMFRMLKKWQKELKGRLPKHENFKPCMKKCPFFKTHECYKKESADQMECWTQLIAAFRKSMNDHLNNMIQEGATTTRCDTKCVDCASLKKCLLSYRMIIEDKVLPLKKVEPESTTPTTTTK